jgi:hypothetical protein
VPETRRAEVFEVRDLALPLLGFGWTNSVLIHEPTIGKVEDVFGLAVAATCNEGGEA